MSKTTEKIENFIVNYLGINLCSVRSIEVCKNGHDEIKNIHIEFIPEQTDNVEEIEYSRISKTGGEAV